MSAAALAALAMLATGLCSAAGIYMTPSFPVQHAFAGSDFFSISFKVTHEDGLPMEGARVRAYWSSEDVFASRSDFGSNCTFYPTTGPMCEAPATSLLGFSTVRAGRAGKPSLKEYSLHVLITDAAGVWLGEPVVYFYVDFRDPPKSLELVSGSGQSAPLGTTLQPFVVRVRNANGTPAVDFPVQFSGPSHPTPIGGQFQGGFGLTVRTDGSGIARSPAMTLANGIGSGNAMAWIPSPEEGVNKTVLFAVTSTTPDGRTKRALEDMWWSGPGIENGWGISIAQREDRLFPVIYAYDSTGLPTWRVISGTWGSGRQYEGYRAQAFSPLGSPYYAYDTSRFTMGTSSAIDIDFDSEGSARLKLYQPGSNTLQLLAKNLTRQDFSSPSKAPLQGVGGMWWGGESQAGWGIALMQQPGGIFAVWFTYGADGKPTWFVMPAGSWTDASTYEGRLYRTRSSPWFGPQYDGFQLLSFDIGTFRFRFTDADHATFEYSADGHAGSMALGKIAF
ncbi:hypothetical protein [Usitatibacter rugosus]|uniref:hypothetical protein n=1 Tax=Usitatibacter rugosus TaxID=2732067 RepID=UPI001489F38B|nr:hypothetical protein [Usitatibacter rugosus]